MARSAPCTEPSRTATSDGISYDPAAEVWRIPAPGSPVRFDFGSLTEASAGLRADAKVAMRAALARSPAGSAYADFDAIRGMLRTAASLSAPVDAFTPGLLRTYEASLPAGRRHLAARLASALWRWRASSAGGLSPDLPGYLARQRSDRHDAGGAVRTLCPRGGALTVAERDGLVAALHAAWAARRIAAADYLMALLVVVLGLRPLQVACLKVGDLRPASDPGAFAADLLVTRLKQRGGARPRARFTARGLTDALAEAVEAQCKAAASHGRALGLEVAECPMFSSMREGTSAPGFTAHMTGAAVGRRVAQVLGRLDTAWNRSARGHVFPLRLRRTFATLLSTDGCGVAEISTLLDHSGPCMARAYIEASPTLARRLGQSSGGAFAGLAARYAVGDDEASAPAPHGSTRP